MTNEEKIEITERAQAIINDFRRPIVIETSISHVTSLIAMVQVALRHPVVKTFPSAQLAEKFCVNLIEKIDPEHGDLWRLLNMGFNSKHDV
jgi:hypothetical protein